MTYAELTDDQRTMAKQQMLCDLMYEQEDATPSYGELAAVDELISDEAATEYYEGVDFVEEDFSC